MLKKRAVKKDLFMEIFKTANRFLSIFFISALGVAFFAGVRAGEPDIRYSADEYFDERNLMDLRVMGTLGLTESDLEALLALPEIEKAETGYSVEMLCDLDGSQKVLQLISELSTLNQTDVEEGRKPTAPGECLIDNSLAKALNYQIGDKITVYPEAEKDIFDTLVTDSFTIVGIGSSPCFISFGRGNTTIGNGEISGFLMVDASSFSLDVYTKIDLTLTGAKEKTAFTSAYDTLSEQGKELLDGHFGREREKIRYQEVMDEANKELADAEKEYQEAKEDAQKQLSDAEQELFDGEQKLKEAKEEYADGEQKLFDGEAEIKENEAKLKTEEQKLFDGEAEIKENRKQYEEGEEAYQDGLTQFDEGKQAYEEGEMELLTKQEEFLKGEKQFQQAEESLVLLKKQAEEITAAGGNPPLTLTMQIQALEMTLEEQRPALEEGKKQLDEAFFILEESKEELLRTERTLQDSRATLDDANRKLLLAERELADGKQQLEDGKQKIADAKIELLDGQKELQDAKQKLKDAEEELADGRKIYTKEKKKADKELADGEQKLADAKEEIEDIEYPEWIVFDRDDLPSYSECGVNADRIKAVGQVFPVIFFLVAALISLTTMTRMVEEQRTQIGTLKSLGYGRMTIAGKYLLYALFATLGGSITGLLIGQKVIPYIIITAYQMMYPNIPNVVTPYHFYYSFLATAAAVLCTTFSAFVACIKELKANPAALMRPVPPKHGKRTWIETTFLWKKLSFNYKSTLRNLIRYKKRFWMTIIGIGGCMALMVVGFGLRDSILAIGEIQYSEIYHYDATVILDEDVTKQEEAELSDFLEKDSRIKGQVPVFMKQITIETNVKYNAYFTVPLRLEGFEEYVQFRDRKTQESYSLTDEGVMINEKLASLLSLKVGDEIVLSLPDLKEQTVKIQFINETYLGNYVYMTPNLYQKLYGMLPEANSILFQKSGEIDLRALGKDILTYPSTLSVSYTDTLMEQLDDMLITLDSVLIVLIVSAGMLAFVVLYNLNNININERRRELATIKVLGFYDAELAGYVYRENVLLTVFGILFGVFAGKLLHGFVVVTVEVENCMFGRTVSVSSYLYCALFTVLFAAIVNGFMYFKLRKIDMVESLKSVE